jgi:putative membrane protein
MKVAAFPTVLTLGALSLCVPAFAKSIPTPTQQSTAHHDTEFLKDANQGSVNEVDLAKFVLTKTSDPDVKEFAQRMITDHTKLLDDMKPFDQEAGVTIPEHPDLSTEAEKAKLELLSGKSFDKAYIKAMVEDHHKDLEAFRKEEKSTGYPAFKTAVSSGADVVQQHLEMINGIAKKNGITPAPVSGM